MGQKEVDDNDTIGHNDNKSMKQDQDQDQNPSVLTVVIELVLCPELSKDYSGDVGTLVAHEPKQISLCRPRYSFKALNLVLEQ